MGETAGAGPQVGSRFGPYELRALLGSGGMGKVYEAFDVEKDRFVALKILSPKLAEDSEYRERFRRESRAAARLGGPHVVGIHDWGEIDGVLFIDMRLVRGSDLRTEIRGGALDPAKAVEIIEQVAAALDSAHTESLIHRDVKPENILLSHDGEAFLADFGIAHWDSDSTLTSLGAAIGSYAYMAPERYESGPIDASVDTYSLACVLCECLTGAAPFPATSISQVIKSHLLTDPPRPSRESPGVPVGLDAVIARGMAKSPPMRYASAGQLAVAARKALNGEDGDTAIEADTGIDVELSNETIIGSAPPHGMPFPPPPVVEPGPPLHEPSPPIRPVAVGIAVGVVGIVVLAIVVALVISGRSEHSPVPPSTDTETVVTTIYTPAYPTLSYPTTTETPQLELPAGATPCPQTFGTVNGYVGSATDNTVTTCTFAENVRQAYASGGAPSDRTVNAYSPATQQSYDMDCVLYSSYVKCTGGQDAEVIIY